MPSVKVSEYDFALACINELANEHSSLMAKVKLLVNEQRFADAYNIAIKAAVTAEKFTLVARELALHIPCLNHMYDTAWEQCEALPAESLNVEIGYTLQGWLALSVPTLLPHKEGGGSEYLRGILYPAIKEFSRKNFTPNLQKYYIIYRFVCAKQYQRTAFDCDNYEINFVTDSMAMMLPCNDDPNHCSYLMTSTITDSPIPNSRTEVYIVPPSELPEWLSWEPTIPPGGPELKGLPRYQVQEPEPEVVAV